MARVAFFTERLPPHADPIAAFSYGLMCSLAEQQHELQVYSTYRPATELPPHPSRLEILRPFKNWGWLEMPRLIPMLLVFRPQILHIIQPHAESLSGISNAMSALPGLKPVLGRPLIVSTFYDLQADRISEQKMLLTNTDLVTVTNSSQAELVTRYCQGFRGKKPQIQILPVPTHRHSSFTTIGKQTTAGENGDPDFGGKITLDPAENLRDFLNNSELIFVPGDLDRHSDLAALFEILAQTLREFPHARVLFGGGWGTFSAMRRREAMSVFTRAGVGARILLSGPISEEVEFICLERSRLVFMASLPLESLSLTRILRSVLVSETVPILTHRQSALDAAPWTNDVHAFFCTETPESWRQTLKKALLSPDQLARMRSQIPEFARAQTLDQPGNVMSRLYSQLLN